MIRTLQTLSTKFAVKVNESLRRPKPLAGLTTCVLCLHPTHSLGLCEACHRDLPTYAMACSRCGLPLPGIQDLPVAICGECLQKPPPFDRVRSLCLYTYPVDTLIQGYKFGGQRAYGRALADALARHLAWQLAGTGWEKPDCLIPCPLHRRRLWERGFNQAAEIAEWLGNALDIPIDYRLIERQRATGAQAGLSRRERLRNLRDAFRVRGKPPAHIALIDDVFTTGATATALAERLRNAGAKRIEVWTLARTDRFR